MLRPADAELAARDPAIPGLATLLDDEAFAQLLRDSAPSFGLRGVVPRYLRYKAGTRCLAAYDLELESETTLAYAVAHGRDAAEKLGKLRLRHSVGSPLGPGVLGFPSCGIGVHVFPNDARLRRLRRLADRESRARTFARLMPDRPELAEARLTALAYKPERRFVARLDLPGRKPAVLKLYAPEGFATAFHNVGAFRDQGALRTARCLGSSQRDGGLAFEWVEGTSLADSLRSGLAADSTFEIVGTALAELHWRSPPGGAHETLRAAAPLCVAADAVAEVQPVLAGRVRQLASALEPSLDVPAEPAVCLHGDFHPDQVLLGDGAATFLDLDRACVGSAAVDLGSLFARLEVLSLVGQIDPQCVGAARDAVMKGYGSVGRPPGSSVLDSHTAAALLAIAIQPFRDREPDWPDRIESIVERSEALLVAATRIVSNRKGLS